MIHSMSGGIISEYEVLTYAFIQICGGAEDGVKRWYISPFIDVEVGARVLVPVRGASCEGVVLRIENVTAQTAPFPVKRTQEIEKIIK